MSRLISSEGGERKTESRVRAWVRQTGTYLTFSHIVATFIVPVRLTEQIYYFYINSVFFFLQTSGVPKRKFVLHHHNICMYNRMGTSSILVCFSKTIKISRHETILRQSSHVRVFFFILRIPVTIHAIT